MGSGQDATPRPVASPPLARKGEHSGHRPRGPSGASSQENYVTVQYRERALAQEEIHSEIPNIVSEVFKEELSYRAQARKFLWEFFD